MPKKKRVHQKFLDRVVERHKRVTFVHFTTHMMGKLLLGLGVGAFFFDFFQPYVVALIIVGLLMHLPFWHHVYLKDL